MNVPTSIALRAPIEAHQEREQHALVGADLHAAHRQPRGLVAQPLLERRFARDHRAQVVVDGLRQQ